MDIPSSKIEIKRGKMGGKDLVGELVQVLLKELIFVLVCGTQLGMKLRELR